MAVTLYVPGFRVLVVDADTADEAVTQLKDAALDLTASTDHQLAELLVDAIEKAVEKASEV